jgi:hypothetical protein
MCDDQQRWIVELVSSSGNTLWLPVAAPPPPLHSLVRVNEFFSPEHAAALLSVYQTTASSSSSVKPNNPLKLLEQFFPPAELQKLSEHQRLDLACILCANPLWLYAFRTHSGLPRLSYAAYERAARGREPLFEESLLRDRVSPLLKRAKEAWRCGYTFEQSDCCTSFDALRSLVNPVLRWLGWRYGALDRRLVWPYPRLIAHRLHYNVLRPLDLTRTGRNDTVSQMQLNRASNDPSDPLLANLLSTVLRCGGVTLLPTQLGGLMPTKIDDTIRPEFYNLFFQNYQFEFISCQNLPLDTLITLLPERKPILIYAADCFSLYAFYKLLRALLSRSVPALAIQYFPERNPDFQLLDTCQYLKTHPVVFDLSTMPELPELLLQPGVTLQNYFLQRECTYELMLTAASHAFLHPVTAVPIRQLDTLLSRHFSDPQVEFIAATMFDRRLIKQALERLQLNTEPQRYYYHRGDYANALYTVHATEPSLRSNLWLPELTVSAQEPSHHSTCVLMPFHRSRRAVRHTVLVSSAPIRVQDFLSTISHASATITLCTELAHCRHLIQTLGINPQ